MNKKQEQPYSLRINPETRTLLDYLIARTGLKQADLIRLAIRRLHEHEAAIEAAAKPARKTR